MADGSHLDYDANIEFTRTITEMAHEQGIGVEAELGRISGTEDGLTIEAFEARFTDPSQAAEFVSATGIDALAVCIGNVHGKYLRPPQFDFERLAEIQRCVTVPLVLHGTSGVPDDMVRRSIELGVRKFNVNTEVRQAYIFSLRKHLMSDSSDLIDLMQAAEAAMRQVIIEKLRLFGSTGKAS
jgi:tagatose 1,6-diphosphate aldolase GatY/KbaY